MYKLQVEEIKTICFIVKIGFAVDPSAALPNSNKTREVLVGKVYRKVTDRINQAVDVNPDCK